MTITLNGTTGITSPTEIIATSVTVPTISVQTINAGTGNTLSLQTNNVTAVTVDTSQNATFAGKVASASSLQLATNGTTTAITVDTSQNVGVGVTPSAWNSSSKAFQFGTNGTAILENFNGLTNTFGFNTYRSVSSGYVYTTTGNAAALFGTSYTGGFAWNMAPSGTAGNAITFTQAMTLDTSGSFLVGTTNNYSIRAVIAGAGQASATGTGSYLVASLADTNTMAQGCGGGLGFQGNDGVNGLVTFASVNGSKENATSGNYASYLSFSTRANGAGITEKARIDSSGNLLVGRTAAVRGGIDAYFANTDGINSSSGQAAGSSRSLFTGWYSATASTQGTLAFNVTTNGNVTNTNNSYGAISDIKLKENITDATPKLEQLCQVRVVNYNFKEGQTQKQLGVIAQELETVFPSMVDEATDRDSEGNDLGTTTKSVKYSVFVPMLIKAIQEQQAMITTLQAQVTALQANVS
jgi:hypothetical protein